MNKILLIDGNSVAYRAFFGMHAVLDKFISPTGLHTNAIYAFKNMVESIVKTEQPTHALVAFDAGKTTFRTEFFDEYKAGREKMPGEFAEQLPYLKNLTAAMGLTHYQLKNFEADDIIGTIAKKSVAEGFEVVVISGDNDLTQLVSDHITVKVTKKGVSDLQEFDIATFAEKYDGLVPMQLIDLKGLAGDTSDNIPGVKSVGPKTAIKLLKEYDSVEGVYEHMDEIKASKMKERLIEDEGNARLSKKLATINQDAPVELELADLTYDGPKTDELIALYRELDFKQFLKNIEPPAEMATLPPIDYQVIDEIKPEYFGQTNAVYVEMLEDNYHTADIVGLAFNNGTTNYILADLSLVQDLFFQDFLANPELKKNVFDVKKTYTALKRLGGDLAGVDVDILLASYLLNPNDNANDLSTIADGFDYHDILRDEDVYGKGAKLAMPEDTTTFYEHLAHKVEGLANVAPVAKDELAKKDQTKLYYDMELPLAFVLADMEITGITVDAPRLEEMKAQFSGRLTEIENTIYEQAGEKFNMNSPKQLGVILFEKMGLPVIKKTKTGYSTAVDVLEQLRKQAPIVDDILAYRQLAKLQSTYVEGLLRVIQPDGKVHTRYLQTLTQTGRLSSVDPNLQNIPVRMEEGRKIRQAFIPRAENWLMYASDYSQIELRVLAHISGDEHLRQAFIDGEDIHASTARRVFGLGADEEVTPNMRRNAKAVNFGIVYGISDYGLSQNLGITRKMAQNYIDTYFAKYPGVKAYMENAVKVAQEQGYVETLYHRRRYLPDIHSKNFNLRSFAERTAINSPIQGSAADILKIAMIMLNEKLASSKIKANMLLQVHDELVFEVLESDLEALDQLVKEVMEHAVDLSIPLITESNWGKTWYDAK